MGLHFGSYSFTIIYIIMYLSTLPLHTRDKYMAELKLEISFVSPCMTFVFARIPFLSSKLASLLWKLAGAFWYYEL